MNHLIRLQRFMRPYLLQISANLFVLLAITGLGLIVPLILQKVIDDGLLRGDIAYRYRLPHLHRKKIAHHPLFLACPPPFILGGVHLLAKLNSGPLIISQKTDAHPLRAGTTSLQRR